MPHDFTEYEPLDPKFDQGFVETVSRPVTLINNHCISLNDT